MTLIADFSWKSKYDSDGQRLLHEFYEPALSCAVRYQRSTGYFCARVLALAARGIERLVRNGGRMQLIVGCTLDPPEVEAIERGEQLRSTVEARLGASPLSAGSPAELDALELLSWMIAQRHLEVKVAVPCGSDRRPVASSGIFHEKAGVIHDKTGARLAFNGSVNETAQGWTGNWESFHVFTEDSGKAHVDDEERTFSRLWEDKARHCRVLDLPAAVQQDLLRFLPEHDARPRRLIETPVEALIPDADAGMEPIPELNLRRLVWGIIRHAPALAAGGERTGEATAPIEPWPHQIRAFQRLYGNWPPRLLIADEVGLGKTIEAGLLLRQAWLSGRAQRILVLAPKAVLRQWQVELREKFNLNWPIYDGSALSWYPSAGSKEIERQAGPDEWHREPFVLCSSQLMRRAERAPELLERAAPYDLVLLDEAHHARRRGVSGTKDRGPNRLLALMRGLRSRTKGLVLLTATPMQIDPVEVWDLLDLLGLPEEWTADCFRSFFERARATNPSHEDFEFLARLFRAVERSFGEAREEDVRRLLPDLSALQSRKVLKALRDPAQSVRRHLESARRKAALKLMHANSPVSRLVSRHTRELLRQYKKAGKLDVQIARRTVQDEFVPLSSAERSVYDAVEAYISTTWDRASDAERNAVGFVMTVYRRRLASSFAALDRTLEGRLQALDASKPDPEVDEDDVLEDEAEDELPDLEDVSELGRTAGQVEETREIALLRQRIKELPTDTKTGALCRILDGLRAQGYPQVMIFTQYTDTLDFLREELSLRQRLSVLCFSGRGGETRGSDGRWRAISREETKKRFQKREAQILLCTDAAAEGLNFQFCGALINYDMPWNPMRVEQRIGRIDRLGQEFDEIQIVNLHYEDTVETDVYRALRERIGLFSRYVGKLQPILAALPRQLADAVLTAPGDRERKRASLVDDLEHSVRQAESSSFDIDEAAPADLEPPVRLPAPYDLADLEALLRRPELLPPGTEVRSLGPSQYGLLRPGMKELRVTTSAGLFDEHPESTELWSPGSPVFPELDDAAPQEVVAQESRTLSEILRS